MRWLRSSPRFAEPPTTGNPSSVEPLDQYSAFGAWTSPWKDPFWTSPPSTAGLQTLQYSSSSFTRSPTGDSPSSAALGSWVCRSEIPACFPSSSPPTSAPSGPEPASGAGTANGATYRSGRPRGHHSSSRLARVLLSILTIANGARRSRRRSLRSYAPARRGCSLRDGLQSRALSRIYVTAFDWHPAFERSTAFPRTWSRSAR